MYTECINKNDYLEKYPAVPAAVLFCKCH